MIGTITILLLVVSFAGLWVFTTGEKIMAALKDLATQLVALNDQVQKSRTEVLAKIAELEAALSNVELPADAQAALESLKASVQAVDDVVPDAAPEPPVSPVESSNAE